jgi:uncharacterized membrane protein (UPF0127 family)
MNVASARPAPCAALALAALALLLGACSREEKPQSLSRASITLGGRAIEVEIARTPKQRVTGMMHRRAIGPDEGMLFVFPYDERFHFYMRNTYVPLSIAFITTGGVIMNIEEMKPLSEETHRSAVPCRYALEMPSGWFERNKIGDGDRIAIPYEVRATE